MTSTTQQSLPRSLAATLSAVLMLTFWVPTLSVPAPAGAETGAAASTHGVLVVSASGAYAPVLM